VFAVLQSMIRVVLVLALAAVPFVVAQVGRTTLHIGGVSYVVDGTRIVLLVGGVLALLAGLLAYRKMDDREQVALFEDVKASLRNDKAALRRMRDGGVFIAFEGGEGAGKSTQIERLASALRNSGRLVVVTHEPGGTEAGTGIRDLLLHKSDPLSARAEALLFAADRAQHVDTVIRPALDAKRVVLTDRYIDSSLAYQGAGRMLSVEEIRRLSRWATQGLTPDLTILLDMPPEAGLARARGDGPGDKVESESLQFHRSVRQAFLHLAEAEPRRYQVIDASRSVDDVAADVLAAVNALISQSDDPVIEPEPSAPSERVAT
jgi:dTMP kinase